jgi:hypothetical protein
MSGGTFDHEDWIIGKIADQLRDEIEAAENEGRYSPAAMRAMRDGLRCIRKAHVYIHRIDWLVAGDDGDATFLNRLEDDLSRI